MKKLYALFSVQISLQIIHHFCFLKKIPDDVRTKALLYKGDWQVFIPLIGLCFIF